MQTLMRQKKSLKIPKGNQNPYIEEEQTTQWSKEKMTKGQTTIYKTYNTTKDRVTRNPLKTGGYIMYYFVMFLPYTQTHVFFHYDLFFFLFLLTFRTTIHHMHFASA